MALPLLTSVAGRLSAIPCNRIKEAASSIYRPRERLNGKINPVFVESTQKRGSECQLHGN